MAAIVASTESLHGIRQRLYGAPGYVVVRAAFNEEQTSYILRFWRSAQNPVVLQRGFDKRKLLRSNCPNYSFFDGDRAVHFNFFWNWPADALTYEICWEVQRLRNLIEGNPPSARYLPIGGDGLSSARGVGDSEHAASYRVVGTQRNGEVKPHRDWIADPSKIQMSIVLSEHGKDYEEGGFLFRTTEGALVNLSETERLRAGDLLIFHYCQEHGVAPVSSRPDQIGFWRILFPLESIRQLGQRTAGGSLVARSGGRLRSLARRARKHFSGATSATRAADAKDAISPILKDAGLAALASIAIECGCSPAEVYYAKGLFGRWQQMQEWQVCVLRAQGLKPSHSFLDIGCGVLRLGLALIPWLEPGRYCGTDPAPAYLRTAEALARSLLPSHRSPHLLLDRHCEFWRFGRQFEFAMAHSVFTHMTFEEIGTCLQQLARVMAPGGKLIFTIALDPAFGRDYEESFVYNAEMPMVRSFHASTAMFERFAEEIGFQFQVLRDAHHPSQTACVACFGAR